MILSHSSLPQNDSPNTQAIFRMLNSHSCVGVAQSTFYIPTLLAAFAMALQRRGNVIFPWAFITLFSLGEYALVSRSPLISEVRIVGGIVLVTYQHRMDSKGWTIAAVVFQGAGVFPLLIVQVGYLMIVYVRMLVIVRWLTRQPYK
jgi:hypothetical protein